MIKDGNVTVGRTPSTISGRPCETVTADGEPVCQNERDQDPGLKKAAAAVGEPPEPAKE